MSIREDGATALEWVARYLERVGELPVLAQVEPGEIRSRLPAAPPEQGEPFAAVLRDLDEVLMPGVTHWQHPRYFAYFANTASDPGILAELLAAALNSVGFLWRTGPALTELELVVLDWLAQLLGLPSGWHGHIEDTASTSTFAALVAAREAAPGRRVVVCSEQAHSSVEKACRMAELELRKVPVDAAYRMRVDALDLTGACAVVATVGTTSTTSVDPVPEIAEACERASAWLHVDAAYAGSAMVCPEFRWAFAGVERADSLVVNAHKWLFTPMDCSCFWSRRPDALRRAFSLVPEYLRTTDTAEVNLMDYSPVLGRRALRRLGALDAGLGGVRPPALLGGLLPARGRRRGERGPARAREPHRRDLPLRHEARWSHGPAAGDRQRPHHRARCAAGLGGAPAGGGERARSGRARAILT